MLLMARVAVPVFDSVTVCAALVVPTVWLAKVSEAGERLAVVVGAAPVPVRPTVCGLPEALSVTLELPVDRKSTRLNSSHVKISYAVFCLKKNKSKHVIRISILL